jgi:hypothetical protein
VYHLGPRQSVINVSSLLTYLKGCLDKNQISASFQTHPESMLLVAEMGQKTVAWKSIGLD